MPHICEYLFGNAGKPFRKAAAVAAGLLVAAKTISVVRGIASSRRRQAAFDSLERNIVHLYGFPRWSLGPNFSSPCLRLEAFLRLNKIPYQVHFTMDPSDSPTERLPFIVYNGEVVADSEFAAQWLTKKFNLTLNASLTAEQHATGLAVRRLVEGSLQFGIYRSMTVDNKAAVINTYAREFRIPRFVAAYFVKQMRSSTIKMLNAVGHGDLTDEQYKSEMLRDLKAIEAIIGDKPFLLGAEPTSYDGNVFASLSIAAAFTEVDTAEFRYLRESPILRAYIERFSNQCFPDLKTITSPAQLKLTVVKYLPPYA